MNNQAEATSLLSQIPFGAVIGSPLKAAVEAQAAAAMACYDFINNVGFDSDPPPTATGAAGAGGTAAAPSAEDLAHVGSPVSVKRVRDITFVFKRARPSADGGAAQSETVSITVPLLTIMPLPFIRIESMTMNFKTAISALDARTQSDTSTSSKELKGDASLGFGWWKLNVGGSISSKKDSTATNTSKYSVEHTIDISLHAVQDDMPAGLARLLGMMTDSIAVTRG